MNEKLTGALQENLLVLLAYDDDNGKVVSNLVDANLFEGDYRLIAERCISYWRRHAEAPKQHTADLFSDIIEDRKNRKAGTFKKLLSAMVHLSESINTLYVVDQLRQFTKMQRIKDAIMKSAEQLSQNQEAAIDQVETIWNDLLHVREVDFEPGLKLLDVDHVLNYLNTHYSEFKIGIEALDKKHIVPSRETALLFLGPAKAGKSWFLINVGKHALLQRKKVLHISLEMSEEQVIQRYYQSLFSVSKRHAKDLEITTFELDALGRIDQFDREKVKPEFSFDSPHVRDELHQRLLWSEMRFSNLYVKRFPTRSLTVNQLIAFLDNLEIVEKFIPDMLILDYVGIMNTKDDNFRISLGRVFEDLRGACIKRHYAFVTAHQTSKVGAESRDVKATHVAEDWSLIATADQVITMSRTDMEKKFGLARLFVTNSRDEGDNFGVLATQNYDMGQFVLDSTLLDLKYYDMFDDWAGMSNDDEDIQDNH